MDVPGRSRGRLLLLTLLVSFLLARRRQKEFLHNSPSRLFHELCRAHRLDLANRRRLKKLAAAENAESAAALFVEPKYFDAANIPQSLNSSANELRQLRSKLFE